MFCCPCIKGESEKSFQDSDDEERNNKEAEHIRTSLLEKNGKTEESVKTEPRSKDIVGSKDPGKQTKEESVNENGLALTDRADFGKDLTVGEREGESFTSNKKEYQEKTWIASRSAPLESYSRGSEEKSVQETKDRGESNKEPEQRQESIEDIIMADALMSAVNRLEGVAARLEQLAVRAGHGQSGAPSQPDTLNPYVIAYDEIISGPFAKFVECSKKIGGEVAEQCAIVAEAFKCQREFLVVGSKSKKPNQNVIQKLLTPTSEKIQAVTAYRDQRRSSSFFNHLSALSESIPALGWVAVEPTPGPYVKDMADAGMFYTNRVLKDFKEKDQTHVDWTKTWLGTLTELQTYIKKFHTTGLAWNPQGVDAADASKASPPVKVPAPGGAPPPPPGPPPPPPPATFDDPRAAPEVDRSALIKDLSKGLDVTKSLKKVTDDMKTHKNPTLRISGPAPFKKQVPIPAQKPVSKPNQFHEDKPPVLELQNKKWVVEYHHGNRDLVLSDTNLKQTVYMYKCTDCTLQVKGKVNSITLDNCKKVAVVFHDVVASVEFVNCQSVQAQSLGKCPTLSIDKTDGCLIYLSKESVNAEIVTAKSSEMNVLVPKDDGDFTEFPIPEQFKTVWNGNKFVTGCTESV